MKGRLAGPPRAAESEEGREKPQDKQAGGASAVRVPTEGRAEVREIVFARRRLCPSGHDTL